LGNSGDAVLRLDSIPQPYRSLLTVDLRIGGVSLGKATLLFASQTFQGDLPRRLAEFVGVQLGMFLDRTRLAESAAELRLEAASLHRESGRTQSAAARGRHPRGPMRHDPGGRAPLDRTAERQNGPDKSRYRGPHYRV